MKTENIHIIYSVNHTRKYLKLSKFTCKHILYLIEKKFQESLSGDRSMGAVVTEGKAFNALKT